MGRGWRGGGRYRRVGGGIEEEDGEREKEGEMKDVKFV